MAEADQNAYNIAVKIFIKLFNDNSFKASIAAKSEALKTIIEQFVREFYFRQLRLFYTNRLFLESPINYEKLKLIVFGSPGCIEKIIEMIFSHYNSDFKQKDETNIIELSKEDFENDIRYEIFYDIFIKIGEHLNLYPHPATKYNTDIITTNGKRDTLTYRDKENIVETYIYKIIDKKVKIDLAFDQVFSANKKTDSSPSCFLNWFNDLLTPKSKFKTRYEYKEKSESYYGSHIEYIEIKTRVHFINNTVNKKIIERGKQVVLYNDLCEFTRIIISNFIYLSKFISKFPTYTSGYDSEQEYSFKRYFSSIINKQKPNFVQDRFIDFFPVFKIGTIDYDKKTPLNKSTFISAVMESMESLVNIIYMYFQYSIFCSLIIDITTKFPDSEELQSIYDSPDSDFGRGLKSFISKKYDILIQKFREKTLQPSSQTLSSSQAQPIPTAKILHPAPLSPPKQSIYNADYDGGVSRRPLKSKHARVRKVKKTKLKTKTKTKTKKRTRKNKY
jgi:hypothetical protein